jgi:hypothetical protein
MHPMTTDSARTIFERWLDAMNRQDFAALRAILHPEYVDEIPQSGERVRGAANMAAIVENYPRRDELRDAIDDAAIVGAEDRWVLTPGFAVVKATGTEDVYTVTARVRYPDGAYWHVILLARLKDGLIYRTRSYYAQEFPAPAWRSQWVERMDGS